MANNWRREPDSRVNTSDLIKKGSSDGKGTAASKIAAGFFEAPATTVTGSMSAGEYPDYTNITNVVDAPLALFTGSVGGAWLDTDPVSRFLNFYSGLPLTEYGNTWGTWVDRSGNGNNLVNTNSGALGIASDIRGIKDTGIINVYQAAAGGGSTTGFYFCASITGTYTYAGTFFTDVGAANTGFRVNHDADQVNDVIFSVGIGSSRVSLSAPSGNAQFAVMAIPTVVEAWSDGVSLFLRINRGITYSALIGGTISAGTTGFLVGAADLANTDVVYGYVHDIIYAKNAYPAGYIRNNIAQDAAIKGKVILALPSPFGSMPATEAADGFAASGTSGAAGGATLNLENTSFAITASPVSVTHQTNLTASPGSYAQTGAAASAFYASNINGASGSYSVSGTAATVSHGYSINAGAGAFVATGVAATGLRETYLNCAPTAYALTGVAATFLKAVVLVAAPAAYSVTGSDATLTKFAVLTNPVLDASPGTLSLTGSPATSTQAATQIFSSLVANFDNTTIAYPPWYTDAVGTGTTVTFSEGRLKLALSNTSPSWAWLYRSSRYNLVDSSVFVRLVVPPHISDNVNGDYAITAFDLGANTVVPDGVGQSGLRWQVNGDGYLSAQYVYDWAGTELFSQVAYDPAVHSWFRIRSDSTTVYWDSAPETASNPPVSGDWVNRASIARSSLPFEIAALDLHLLHSIWSSVSGDLTTVEWDGLNAAASAIMKALPGSYSETGAAATLHRDVSINADPSAAFFDIAGSVASILAAHNVAASASSFTVTGVAATGLRETYLNCAPTAYALTGAPLSAVASHVSLNAAPGAYTVAGSPATGIYSASINAAAGAYSVTGSAETSIRAASLNAAPGAYAVAGSPAIFSEQFSLNLAAGSFSITGADANLAKQLIISGFPAGTYSVTGFDAGMLRAVPLSSAPGAFSITGAAANLQADYPFNASAGTYSATGFQAKSHLSFTASAAAFSITGADANLSVFAATIVLLPGSYSITPATVFNLEGHSLNANQGSYTLTGFATGFNDTHLINAEAGAFSLLGEAASLVHNDTKFTASPGSFSWTGTATSLHRDASPFLAPNALTLTGADASIFASKYFTASPGQYLFTTYMAALETGLVASSGAYTITGAAATLSYRASIIATPPGIYSITGADAALLAKNVIVAAPGACSITGADASMSIGLSSFNAPGAYTVTGADADLHLVISLIIADSGVYTISGVDAVVGRILGSVAGDRTLNNPTEGRQPSLTDARNPDSQLGTRVESTSSTRSPTGQAGARGSNLQRT